MYKRQTRSGGGSSSRGALAALGEAVFLCCAVRLCFFFFKIKLHLPARPGLDARPDSTLGSKATMIDDETETGNPTPVALLVRHYYLLNLM